MQVITDDYLYVIPQANIEAFGLSDAQLFFDAGKISADEFIRMYEDELDKRGFMTQRISGE